MVLTNTGSLELESVNWLFSFSDLCSRLSIAAQYPIVKRHRAKKTTPRRLFIVNEAMFYNETLALRSRPALLILTRFSTSREQLNYNLLIPRHCLELNTGRFYAGSTQIPLSNQSMLWLSNNVLVMLVLVSLFFGQQVCGVK